MQSEFSFLEREIRPPVDYSAAHVAYWNWSVSMYPKNLQKYIRNENLTFKEFLEKDFIDVTIMGKKRGMKEARFDWSLVEYCRAKRPPSSPKVSAPFTIRFKR